MKYDPTLDGMRALAVMAVVGTHAGVPGFGGGAFGVDFFFVLSGYLITRILSENHPTLRDFYVRRFMRLTPALAFMLTGYLAFFSWLTPDYPHWRDALLAMFYLTDYSRLWKLPLFLIHTWSLSVEEHFYLIWPLILYRLKPSLRALIVAYLVVTVWRWIPGQPVAYGRFDTRGAALIVGCIIAFLPRGRFPAWPALILLGAACTLNIWQMTHWNRAALFVAVEWLAAAAVLGRAPAWLGQRLLVYVGKLSYGIYLWHWPIVVVLKDFLYLHWTEVLAGTVIGSVVMAALSYHTIEATVRWYRRKPAEAVPVTR